MSNINFSTNGPVAKIIIDRHEAMNALNSDIIETLGETIKRISMDQNIRSVIISGAGEKAFVAGADIKEMLNFTVNEANTYSLKGQKVFFAIENMPQVVIAAVNGFALGGGCELAMACDIRIASKNAKFGLPEINLGIISGYAGTQRLPRLIGLSRAKEMIFSGEMIDADTAYRIGLVNKVCSSNDLMTIALDMAQQFASKSFNAIKLAKAVINSSINTDLVSGCYFEASAFSLCFSSDDQKEGMSAFLEKRKPKYNN